MATCDIIEGNLSLYQRQVAQQQWKVDREATGQCCALEAVLAHGLMIHDHLERHAQRPCDNKEVDRQSLAAWCNAWRRWLEPCPALLGEIRRFEQMGYTVENADRFRERVAAVTSMPLDEEEILRLRERSVTSGKTVPLKAAFDELLRRAQARGD